MEWGLTQSRMARKQLRHDRHTVSLIDRYFEQCNQLVGPRIARDKTEAAELKQHSKIIRVDLDQLKSRQQQLSHVKEKLQLYNSYEGGLYGI